MKNQQTTAPDFTIDHLRTWSKEGHANGSHDAGFGQIVLARMRADYARIYAQYLAACTAQSEGVYEVTIKGPTQTVSMLVGNQSGFEFAEKMTRKLGKRLDHLADCILSQLKDEQMCFEEYGRPDLHAEAAAIHALCLPQATPEQPAPEVAGERCPFLPGPAPAEATPPQTAPRRRAARA